jgi:hypothetical protein
MADQPTDPTHEAPESNEFDEHRPGEEPLADPRQAVEDPTSEADLADVGDLLDQARALPEDDAEDYPHEAPGSSGP